MYLKMSMIIAEMGMGCGCLAFSLSYDTQAELENREQFLCCWIPT